ncbi:hypothetical protein K474DRAFT_1666544 [Panus rudis PR-1116 ss-1]|nr:hypothetical protein K474DRAFT_1666544 [Panus rudis PR-1116 ss-1]
MARALRLNQRLLLQLRPRLKLLNRRLPPVRTQRVMYYLGRHTMVHIQGLLPSEPRQCEAMRLIDHYPSRRRHHQAW